MLTGRALGQSAFGERGVQPLGLKEQKIVGNRNPAHGFHLAWQGLKCAAPLAA
jgi:hypothetical protein